MKSLVLTLLLATAGFSSHMAAASAGCEPLLKELQPHLGSVPPFLGTVRAERKIPDEVKALVAGEGGEVIFLGKGATGQVYRWYRKNKVPVLVKYYMLRSDADMDDDLFVILESAAKPGDYVRVNPQVLPKTEHLRFYADVRGVTYGSLERTDLPRELHERVREEYLKYMGTLFRRLQTIYGKDAVTKNRWMSNVIAVFDDGEFKSINLHIHNMLFDSDTGRLWIIDPE